MSKISTVSCTMMPCETFRVSLLLGVCLTAWAAPLGSTSPPPHVRLCDRTEEESKKPTEQLGSHHDDKLCTVSPMELSPFPHELRGTGGILDGASHEGIGGEIDAVRGIKRQGELVGRRATQNQGSPDESSSEEKHKSSAYATSFDPNGETEAVMLAASTAAADQINPKKPLTAQNERMRSDRPAPTPAALGHGDYMGPGNLLYSNVEEEAGATMRPPTRAPPQEEQRGWEVDSINRNLSVSVNPKHWSGVSTEPNFVVSPSAHDSVNQSPSIFSPAGTSLAPSDSFKGEPGGSTEKKESVEEEQIFTATEPQEKAVPLGLLQPDLTLSSTPAELGGTWTVPVHLQGGEEVSVLPLLQEVSTEVTMSSEHLPLIFEPLDDVTPASSSVAASEPSVAIEPETEMPGEAELEQAVSMDTDHAPSDASLLGPSDWSSPWQMSGADTADAVTPSQMPINRPFSEADLELSERTVRLQNTELMPTSLRAHSLSQSAVPATTQQVTHVQPSHPPMLKPKSGLEEVDSEEDEDEEDEDINESEEEESEEDLTEVPVQAPTRPPYRLIPPPPVWGQRNQGLIRSWVELIQEKAGYVSGMLAPVGIGIAGALLIVGALYSIRMIHRKRRNNFKHQRRKQQPKEVRNGPDQAMLLADSSEDEL